MSSPLFDTPELSFTTLHGVGAIACDADTTPLKLNHSPRNSSLRDIVAIAAQQDAVRSSGACRAPLVDLVMDYKHYPESDIMESAASPLTILSATALSCANKKPRRNAALSQQ
ncbi:hypothetical protein [Bradyrhizobium sp. 170]|uniref:hypothetical protein n=1 Tax=Bradyrhizobium sp. 170 TaxID=2782641 RepID=UPI001FFE7AA9|nr:hypothetical protein [Bradyrhizobium sp. 170]UPK05164.1 hypothetical protein IVB05_05440 [Bradyrhizobium sp. 170]